ncbi:uncharacterized protein LOC141844832 [Curcuma longa]|uniref:uncharacterized protein LOC141844832 n=1 Tax=Curcuma longa TaxID=136217 RepID=UPI003D9DE22D
MASRSPASGESERDTDRDRERELATASRSADSGECERGGDGEREIATTSRSPASGECERGGDAEREIATTSRSPDSGEGDRGGDGEKERKSAMASSSSARTPNYRNASYWDERYRDNDSTYDWYMNYPSLVSLFDLYLRLDHRILNIGCGNSVLGEDMIDAGYQDVVNIDISSVLIETMQAKYADKLALKYIKMDVRDMSPFESGSFDAVIDKGTLDTLMCGEDDIVVATQLLKEINWELSATWPLDRDGSWVTEVLRSQLDLFYVYVCIKDESLSAKQATDTEIPSSQNDT